MRQSWPDVRITIDKNKVIDSEFNETVSDKTTSISSSSEYIPVFSLPFQYDKADLFQYFILSFHHSNSS